MHQRQVSSAAVVVAIVLQLLLGGCASLPEDVPRPASFAYTDTDDTRLGQARRDEIRAHPGQSGVLLLGSGLDAFVARALLADAAERSIDAQYYLLHADLTGALFVDQLLKAADRGVRVRLLVDDMDLAGRDLGAAVLDAHPNMEVRIFNPFSRNALRGVQFVSRFGSVTRRMHNKSFIADNQAAILGGRNIGDEYFDADAELTFSDLDVVLIGPVVEEVSESFDAYWNHELAYPAAALNGAPPTPEEIAQLRRRLEDSVAQQRDSPYLQALRNSDLAERVRHDQVRYLWGAAEVVYDSPEKIAAEDDQSEYHLAPAVKPYFRGVREELIIFSPYFVPQASGVAFLEQLVARGVRVRILTNSLASTDVGVVHAGYAKYRKALLRAGVELYEFRPALTPRQRERTRHLRGSSRGSLHTKAFVFDRKDVFIGSVNLDPRSLYENTEVGVMLTSPEVGRILGELFDGNINQVAFRLALQTDADAQERIVWHGVEDGQATTYTVEPYTSFWRRFGIGFLGLLPIESQL